MPAFSLTEKSTTILPGILNGGNKNVDFQDKTFVLYNTSAFDCLCQIFAMAIKNSTSFRDAVNRTNSVVVAAQILIDQGFGIALSAKGENFC